MKRIHIHRANLVDNRNNRTMKPVITVDRGDTQKPIAECHEVDMVAGGHMIRIRYMPHDKPSGQPHLWIEVPEEVDLKFRTLKAPE